MGVVDLIPDAGRVCYCAADLLTESIPVPTKVSINGVVFDESQAAIPVTDRGFLYGDSVYEVVRTYGGRPYALAEHLERLKRSADLLDLELPGGVAPIEGDLRQTLAAAGNAESYVRVIVTRGSGSIGLDPALADRPRRVIIVGPLTPLPRENYEQGVGIRLVATGRSGRQTISQGAKSGNYLMNVLALGRARRLGAHEAVLLDQGDHVTEGASSNLFVVRAGGVVTPPLTAGILEGITRHKIFALAEDAGVSVSAGDLTGAELREAEEIFLTSTLREVLPVTQVDDWKVGSGRPGPITARLHRAFSQAVKKEMGEP